ncbi:cation diffusion facilitator family transporter [Oceanispirochaeta sp.]|jgi:cation diffusion facilitator family transporter|uniref:cation diffusion facilitator family transporter n=1 Tax=Oceanispirochaeta sp. TaxID=2035350 RepID=UPI00260AED29|nr:cation diffusion facilitator family transporter [Oceanispirochaeta sp.]MDA3957822.1 cation diffusion facilitator family transporter [Oceanispirochaeta sp.]
MNEAFERASQASRITLIGSIVNLLLSIAKMAAGIVAGSAAMVADSVHSLSDLATDIVVLATIKLAKQPVDRNHQYGHGKFETLGTVFIGGALLAVGAGLLISGGQAILQALEGEIPGKPGNLALVAAASSILAKEILYRYTLRVGKKIRSQAVIANAWHHRSDAFSSIGALLGISGAILLGPSFHILDPIAGIIVSAIICWTAFGILKNALAELVEAAVEPELQDKVLQIAGNVPGVTDPHNLRMRRVGSYIVLDLHIRVDRNMSIQNAHQKCHEVEKVITKELGSPIVTIHAEPDEWS